MELQILKISKKVNIFFYFRDQRPLVELDINFKTHSLTQKLIQSKFWIKAYLCYHMKLQVFLCLNSQKYLENISVKSTQNLCCPLRVTWRENRSCWLSISLNNAAEAIILGFQHYLVMLGTTVIIPTIIVPQMGGGNVSIYFINKFKEQFGLLVYLQYWFQNYVFQEEKAQVIQTLLFVAGLNTLLQSLFGTRLPVVIGGSFTFIIPATFVALSSRYNTYLDPREVGILHLVASVFCFYVWDWTRPPKHI